MTILTESRVTAAPLTSAGILASIASRIMAYRSSRRVLKDLVAMEDHILTDIGLTRADVIQASVAERGADRIAMLNRARMRRLA